MGSRRERKGLSGNRHLPGVVEVQDREHGKLPTGGEGERAVVTGRPAAKRRGPREWRCERSTQSVGKPRTGGRPAAGWLSQSRRDPHDNPGECTGGMSGNSDRRRRDQQVLSRVRCKSHARFSTGRVEKQASALRSALTQRRPRQWQRCGLRVPFRARRLTASVRAGAAGGGGTRVVSRGQRSLRSGTWRVRRARPQGSM